MISFKGTPFPKDVIFHAVFFYVRYGVSYRDLEEIMAERDVKVDHATLNRWVIDYSPLIATETKKRNVPLQRLGGWMKPTLRSKEKWVYLYPAVDKFGDTIDLMLSEQLDEVTVTMFFKQVITNNGVPP